jgi:hypothetical protein
MEKNKWGIFGSIAGIMAVGFFTYQLAIITPERPNLEDGAYIKELKEIDNSYISITPTEQLVQFGTETCNVLDAGFTMNEAVTHLAVQFPTDEYGDIAEFVGAIITSAVHNICPKHNNLLY